MNLKRLTTVAGVVIVFFSINWAAADPYYVDNRPGVGDDDDNDGLWPVNATGAPVNPTGESGPFASLQKAASVVQPGDTVFVRATDIPYDQFYMETSGDDDPSGGPIQFLGFETNPGDLQGGKGVPEDYSEIGFDANGQPNLTLKKCPWIKGPSRQHDSSNYGIDFNDKSYIVVSNFWVSNASIGIDLRNGCQWCTVRDCFVWNCGDPTPGGGSHDGRGIIIGDVASGTGANNNDLLDSCLYNAGNQAVTIVVGNSNDVIGCHVYADDNSDSKGSNTHYYFVLEDGEDNYFSSCIADRRPDPVHGKLHHPGHGFVIQARNVPDTPTQVSCDNYIVDCTTYDIGESISLRGRSVYFNNISDHTSCVDEDSEFVSGDQFAFNELGCVLLMGGPNSNHFSNLRFYNSDTAITAAGLLTYGPAADAAESAADHNTFENCLFECEVAFRLLDYDDERSATRNLEDGDSVQDFKDNEFVHCNFIADGQTNLGVTMTSRGYGTLFFDSSRNAEYNWIANCIISGFDDYVGTTASTNNPDNVTNPGDPGKAPFVDGGGVVLGFEFDHCHIYNPNPNTAFPALSSLGPGNIGGSFAWYDAANDYELFSVSPCINKGNTTSSVSEDIDGDARGSLPDIGVQEF